MTVINLNGENGQLLPYSRELLSAYAHFHDDAITREAVANVLRMEYAEWARAGTDYQPSYVATKLLELADKRAGQVWSAGWVGLAMVGLKSIGRTPSINAAIQLAEQLASEKNKYDFMFYDPKRRVHVQRPQAIASDFATMRQNFSRYRPAVHLCAARVISVDYLEPLHFFEAAPEADKCLVATACALQGWFTTEGKSEDWGLFQLYPPPDLLSTADVLQPIGELMEKIAAMASASTGSSR